MSFDLWRRWTPLLTVTKKHQQSCGHCDHDSRKGEHEYASRLLIPFLFAPLCEFGMRCRACPILEFVHIVSRCSHNVRSVVCHTYLLSSFPFVALRRRQFGKSPPECYE